MGKSVFRRGDTLKGISNGSYFLTGSQESGDKKKYFMTAVWPIEKDGQLYIVNNTELTFPDSSAERLQTINIATKEQFDSISEKLSQAAANGEPYYNKESKMLRNFFGDDKWNVDFTSFPISEKEVSLFIDAETVFKITFDYQGFKDLGNDWYSIFYKNDSSYYVLDVNAKDGVLCCNALDIIDSTQFDERSFDMNTSKKLFEEFETSDFDKNELRIFPKQTLFSEIKISVNGRGINDIFEIDTVEPDFEEDYER